MTDRDPALPRQSAWLTRWFTRHSHRYAARHFHAVRRSRTSCPVPADGSPLLFVVNHPSWWDVILMFIAAARFPKYRHFAPIEAGMLQRYRILGRLGLFGIDPTPRGAAIFLRTAKAIFSSPFGAVWVTAQGRFADVRERPVVLRPGVGAVAARMDRGYIVPAAIEYPFWDERTPEALFRFGEPMDVAGSPGLDARAWTAIIETALTRTMDTLAAEATRRDPGAFDTLVRGRVGVGGVYDAWRRFTARLTGRRVRLEHSASPEGTPP